MYYIDIRNSKIMRPLIIAVDIDGTITNTTSYQEHTEVVAEMIEFVNYLYDQGYKIYFYTAREHDFYEHTVNLLDSFGFKYHALVMNKIFYDVLLDDKAISWKDGFTEENVKKVLDTLDEIKQRKTKKLTKTIEVI
jgi:hydroxymethylpyrimidine pyrophosphatase-like HAD family hydrolase